MQAVLFGVITRFCSYTYVTSLTSAILFAFPKHLSLQIGPPHPSRCRCVWLTSHWQAASTIKTHHSGDLTSPSPWNSAPRPRVSIRTQRSGYWVDMLAGEVATQPYMCSTHVLLPHMIKRILGRLYSRLQLASEDPDHRDTS
jgi:hypothetical protein